jgi:hypothetical protein
MRSERLVLTRVVERWVWAHRRAALWRGGAWGLAMLGPACLIALSVFVWVPHLRFLYGLPLVLVVAAALVFRFHARRKVEPDRLVERVDERAQIHGLLRTALSVERGLAVGDRDLQSAILHRGREALPGLEPLGVPDQAPPSIPLAIAFASVILAAGVVAWVIVAPVIPRVQVWGTFAEDGRDVGLDPYLRESLLGVADDIERLSKEAGLDPRARAALERARDAMRTGVEGSDDLRHVVAELGLASSELRNAQRSGLRSEAALASARSDAIAETLANAAQRGDRATALRMVDEIRKRVDSERSEGEIRRLGRTLAGRAGEVEPALQRAGDQLAAGDREGALAGLSDVVARLGEAGRGEPERNELGELIREVDRAREQARERIEQAERSRNERPADGGVGGQGDRPGEVPEDAPRSAGDLADDQDARARDQDSGAGAEDVDAPTQNVSRFDGDGEGIRDVAGDGRATSDDERSGPGGAADGGTDGTGSGGTGQGAAGAMASDGSAGTGAGRGQGSGTALGLPEVGPEVSGAERVQSVSVMASDELGEVLSAAEASGRAHRRWESVVTEYAIAAEADARREVVPASRARYVQRYFEAIRPSNSTEEP